MAHETTVAHKAVGTGDNCITSWQTRLGTLILNLWPPGTADTEVYSHLLKLPHLRQLTVWPPPPQSATNFWCDPDAALLHTLNLTTMASPSVHARAQEVVCAIMSHQIQLGFPDVLPYAVLTSMLLMRLVLNVTCPVCACRRMAAKIQRSQRLMLKTTASFMAEF